MLGWSLRARETVEGATPAARAMSLIVRDIGMIFDANVCVNNSMDEHQNQALFSAALLDIGAEPQADGGKKDAD
jgi:hypothetical protein